MSDISNDFVITDENAHKLLELDKVEWKRSNRCGLVRRDYERRPVGCYGAATAWDTNIPLIPREEWPERIRQLEMEKARLSDIRDVGNNSKPIESLDQNGQGYCWAYSSTAAVMLLRAAANMPHVRLSAHSVGCMVKNFRDQGGWSALSLDFIMTRGIAPVSAWAEKSMSRSNDNAATWEAAKNFRTTEGWVETGAAVYDRDLTFDQFFTCLLSRIPVPSDYYYWGHAVCACDPVEVDARLPLDNINRWGARIWNSWRDAWGTRGMGVLVGSKAVPDGAVAPRVVFGGG